MDKGMQVGLQVEFQVSSPLQFKINAITQVKPGITMNESGFWLLRCGNQVLTAIDQAPESVFPYGQAADFGNPEDALLIGEWQG